MTMKKELLALALLLGLILGAFLNIAHLTRLTEAVAARVSLAETAAAQADFEAACNALDSARELWDSSQRYTGVFIGPQELESVDEAFFSLRAALLQADPAAAQAACEKLFFQLQTLLDREKISLETVL